MASTKEHGFSVKSGKLPGSLPRVLRRLVVTAKYFGNPRVRQGYQWTRQGWRLSRRDLEARALKRLAGLVQGFEVSGLLAGAEARCLSKLDSLAGLAAHPVLTRARAVELFERMRAHYAGRDDLVVKGTGGWSGEPVHHYRDRRVDDYGYGMLLAMQDVLGWRPGQTCHCLWSNPHELGVDYGKPGGFRQQLKMVQLHGRYSPGPAEFEEFLAAVRADPGCSVYGFPNLLLQCANYMRDRGIVLERGIVAAAWGTAEALHKHLPARFEAQFNVPLRDFYGSREMASIAAECESGRRHVNSRYLVEVVDPATLEPVPAGTSGSLLLTDLFNHVTPFIRYQLGDFGSLDWCECECGRSGYYLPDLIGRPPDLITLKSGHRFTPHFFSTVTMSYPAIHSFQTIRHGLEEFELRYVGRQLAQADRDRILALLTKKTEGAACRLVKVDELERSSSGKARWYIDRQAIDSVSDGEAEARAMVASSTKGR
ncbi:phenylacetate--CoA ligase family protein [bacterium]|nr:phenylacetate--CoA ligase family protein [bacterium]